MEHIPSAATAKAIMHVCIRSQAAVSKSTRGHQLEVYRDNQRASQYA
jgi:hypothetical protein